MTFKHIKFSESEIMQSFEKLAYDKGMIKQEPVIKTASPTYEPTNNLNENILKLCEALRNKGLIVKAEELESNYLNYKAAEALDPGEQRIQDAHPESPNFGTNEYGLIENILQEHKRILDVVNKQPTGKLTANGILRGVKQVLAGEEWTVDVGDIVYDEPVEVDVGDITYDNDVEVEVGDIEFDPKLSSKKKIKLKTAQESPISERFNAASIYLNPMSANLNFALNEAIKANNLYSSVDRGAYNLKLKEQVSNSLKYVKHNLLDLFQSLNQPITINSIKRMIQPTVNSINGLSGMKKSKVDKVDVAVHDSINSALSQVRGVHIALNEALNLLTGNSDTLGGKSAAEIIADNNLKLHQEKAKKENKVSTNPNIIRAAKEIEKLRNHFKIWINEALVGFEDPEHGKAAAKYIQDELMGYLKNIEKFFNSTKELNPDYAATKTLEKLQAIPKTEEFQRVVNEWKLKAWE